MFPGLDRWVFRGNRCLERAKKTLVCVFSFFFGPQQRARAHCEPLMSGAHVLDYSLLKGSPDNAGHPEEDVEVVPMHLQNNLKTKMNRV